MDKALPVRPTFPWRSGETRLYRRPRWARHLEPRDGGGVICPCCGLVFGAGESALASWHVQAEHPIPTDEELREMAWFHAEEQHVIDSIRRGVREAELRAELEAL